MTDANREDLRNRLRKRFAQVTAEKATANRFTGTCQVCLAADGVTYCEHGKSVCAKHINHNPDECGAA